MLWMINNNKSMDESIPYKTRKKCALLCEKLIKTEYQIIKDINNYFDGKINERT
jgi:hypothetical protein